MNLLQNFMAEALSQVRGTGGTNESLAMEEFTIVGEVSPPATPRLGVFGNSTVIPIMTRQGYQDHEVSFLTVEASLFATAPSPRITINRTSTGQNLFVHAVENKDPVLFTFTLTEREL